jgi:hypothetical protein
MRQQNTTDRARLKAVMWEIVILRLLQENDFTEIHSVDNVRMRREREQFLEMRGRGCWHQIDCPCDYTNFIAFINPIRLLGEVKFYKVPITKDEIRQFVGVLKDIQENWITSDNQTGPTERYTELGVFFAANGFDVEAEKLAFAHNIKTVSHKSVALMKPLKEHIEELERNYLSTQQCVAAGCQAEFTRAFKRCIQDDGAAIPEFSRNFAAAEGAERLLDDLRNSFQAIRSNFVATTSGGVLLHFVGDSDFPAELFAQSDVQMCRVYYYRQDGKRYFYLTFPDDGERRRFYFNPPVALDLAAFYGQREAAGVKRQIFKSIHTTRRIRGLSRNLTLKLDTDWLDAIERRLA